VFTDSSEDSTQNASNSDWDTYEETIMRFNISAIPSGSTCLLKIYASAQNDSYFTVYVRRITSSISNWDSINDTSDYTDTTTNQVAWRVETESYTQFSVNISQLVADESSDTLEIVITTGSMISDFSNRIRMYSLSHSTASYRPYISYTPATTFYVKASGGSDSNLGTSWTAAWATVNKAMVTAPNNSTIYVGFGTYSSEASNNTLSPDGSNVTVRYVTSGSSSGTGTATVEVNP
jgi:hypothetical protein